MDFSLNGWLIRQNEGIKKGYLCNINYCQNFLFQNYADFVKIIQFIMLFWRINIMYVWEQDKAKKVLDCGNKRKKSLLGLQDWKNPMGDPRGDKNPMHILFFEKLASIYNSC